MSRKAAGKNGRCPSCASVVKVPQLPEAAQSSAIALDGSDELPNFSELSPVEVKRAAMEAEGVARQRRQLEAERARLEAERRQLEQARLSQQARRELEYEGDPSELDDLDDDDDTRECPDCAERIKARARVCRFCGWGREQSSKGKVPSAKRGHMRSRDPGSPAAVSAATSSLVLGILGLLVCGILAPFAILQANASARYARIARVPTPGTATAGLILGWIQVGYFLLVVLWVVAAGGLAATLRRF